jgi:glycine hydroxymethyltransferase
MHERNVKWIEEVVGQQNEWRRNTINLIASENVMSTRARAVMGSDFAHRYAEGHPGERYYQGTDKIDEIESWIKLQLKTLFNCQHMEVRPISGTIANDAVFSRYIAPGDVVMVNSTAGGGHISHHKSGSVGKYTKNIVDFPLTPDGYHLDCEQTEKLIAKLHPRVLILGKSLFLFPEPVRELRKVCSDNGTTVIYDAAHVLGLIAGKRFQNPLAEGADIMTASTHKTFFGSQRGLIMSNLSTTCEMVAFAEAYATQTVANAKALARSLSDMGFNVQAKAFDFTESHQIAIDVSELGGGNEVARILKENDIILNMNLLPFEPLEKVTNPAGIRIGVQEMTRFGMKEGEMEKIAALFRKCLKASHSVNSEVRELRSAFQKVLYSFDE